MRLEGASQPGFDPHGDGLVISCPAPGLSIFVSAYLPDCTVRALSLPMNFCRATPGAKPNSSHLQERHHFSFLQEGVLASNSPDLLFSVCRNCCSVNYKALGYQYFLQSIIDCPRSHRSSLSAWTAATHPTLTTGAFRLQSTSSGLFCDVFGLCCLVRFSVLLWKCRWLLSKLIIFCLASQTPFSNSSKISAVSDLAFTYLSNELPTRYLWCSLGPPCLYLVSLSSSQTSFIFYSFFIIYF